MSTPRHVAIIMDGNGRWAQARGESRTSGHRSGLETVRMCIEESIRCGIEALTLFAFSSENWQRPAAEVNTLMSLFVESLDREVAELHANGVRMRFIGERSGLAVRLQSRIVETEAHMAANKGLQLQIALNYGGRWDIVAAARSLARECASGALRERDIDETAFVQHLALAGLPDPDLFVRTGGEQRISNFLLWNLAYTELYFTDVLWPDFSAADFTQAVAHFAQRERRFGKVSAQLEATS